MWYGKKPNLSHLRVFGCVAYAHVPDCERKKFDKKARKLRFVGYGATSKGYRLFDERTRKLIKSRDVIFDEGVFEIVKEQPEERVSVDSDIADPVDKHAEP